MAKISAYPNGNPPQDSDEFIVARAGDNRKLTWANIKTALSLLYDWATVVHAAPNKAVPADADELGIWNSVGGVIGHLTWANVKAALGDKYAMEARLTLETGVPVSITNQTAKTVLYLTPYKGCQVATYDGVSAWSTAELTADLSLNIGAYTASKNYDIWVYTNAGTLTLDSTIWTNDTTRATALVYQNGILVKSGDTTRRYIGTIRITSIAGECADSLGNRLAWNYYNRIRRPFGIREAGNTNSWPYNGTTLVWRPANNNVANRVNFVVGVAEDEISARVAGIASHAVATSYAIFGIGINSTTSNSSGSIIGGVTYLGAGAANTIFPTYGYIDFIPSAGFTYLQWVESSQSGGTGTFYGWPAQPDDLRQSGVSGSLQG